MKEYQFKGTKGEWHPVQYAGFWQVQYGEFYGDVDLLNYDDVLSREMNLPYVSEEMAKANAQLMASSPDLLKACIDIAESLHDTDPRRAPIINAINKALGL